MRVKSFFIFYLILLGCQKSESPIMTDDKKEKMLEVNLQDYADLWKTSVNNGIFQDQDPDHTTYVGNPRVTDNPDQEHLGGDDDGFFCPLPVTTCLATIVVTNELNQFHSDFMNHVDNGTTSDFFSSSEWDSIFGDTNHIKGLRNNTLALKRFVNSDDSTGYYAAYPSGLDTVWIDSIKFFLPIDERVIY